MPKRLTPPQQKVMERLRAGEHLYSWVVGDKNRAAIKYRFSGGGEITERTHSALRMAQLIHIVLHPWRDTVKWEHWMKKRVWIAADPQEASKCQSG